MGVSTTRRRAGPFLAFGCVVLALGNTLSTAYLPALVAGSLDATAAFSGALMILVQAGCIVGALVLLGGSLRRAPATLSDFVRILAASTIGASLSAVLFLVRAPLPGRADEVLFWVGHTTAAASIALALVLTLLHGLIGTHGQVSSTLRAVNWPEFIALALLSLAAFALALRPEAVIVGWLVLVPALWAGSRLVPVSGALLCGLVGIVISVFVALPVGTHSIGYGGAPVWAIFDGSLTAFTFTVLYMISLRESRERLVEMADTQRRQASEYAAAMGLILESMSDGAVILDDAGLPEFYNPRAVALIGGAWLSKPAGQWPGADRFDPAAVEVGTSQVVTMPGPVRVDGREAMLSVQLSRMLLGDKPKWVVLVRNVTYDVEKVESLEHFAEVAAHDLKSPLTALTGWMQLAESALDEDFDDPADAVHALRRSVEVANRMARQLDDVLALNLARDVRMLAGTTSIGDLVREVAATFPGAEVSVEAPHQVRANEVLVRQLLENLIGNSVKYARPGQPPRLQVSSFLTEAGWVQVDLADAGIGVPPGEEEQIFEQFARATSVAGDQRGAGMGLALCRQIVSRHGGEIWAQGNDQGGLTVSFRLPSAIASATA